MRSSNQPVGASGRGFSAPIRGSVEALLIKPSRPWTVTSRPALNTPLIVDDRVAAVTLFKERAQRMQTLHLITPQYEEARVWWVLNQESTLGCREDQHVRLLASCRKLHGVCPEYGLTQSESFVGGHNLFYSYTML